MNRPNTTSRQRFHQFATPHSSSNDSSTSTPRPSYAESIVSATPPTPAHLSQAYLLKTPQSSSSAPKSYTLYWQRWHMLFWMSLLNLLSDWTCYSIAPIAMLTNEAYGVIYPTALVVVFLFANGISTAMEPFLLSLLGFRRLIVFGAFLGAAGSLLKSGLPFRYVLTEGDEWRVYLGFLLVGLSQPMYQCTPALLSASWFPEKERTLATGIALNANQLGIGCAFVYGAIVVRQKEDISVYFSWLSVLFCVGFVGTLFFFEERPKTPPSETARRLTNVMDEWVDAENWMLRLAGEEGRNDYGSRSGGEKRKKKEETEGIWRSLRRCFAQEGFGHAVAAFTVGGIVINTLSAYMDYLVRLDENADGRTVGIVGGSFQILVMVASLLVGHGTDRTRAYFTVMLVLLVLGGFVLAGCGMLLVNKVNFLPWALLGVAVVVGPLQPVATELGVDVAYPQCENTVLVVLQLFSNFCSSLFIPVFHFFRNFGNERPEYAFSFYLLILLQSVVTVYFATFSGRYRRLECELNRKGGRVQNIKGETLPLLGPAFDF